ncbi:unnamed protein product [Clavelina lepadiformis]|uniref:Peptidase S1 domain-containing protein n=1 Tax=Clavelina lepadiformis TaxID=159417 RepID=A0ABP0FVD9_CLALP
MYSRLLALLFCQLCIVFSVQGKKYIFLDVNKPINTGDEIILEGTFLNKVSQVRLISDSTSCTGGTPRGSGKPPQCQPLVLLFRPRRHLIQALFHGADNEFADVMLHSVYHKDISKFQSFRLLILVGARNYTIQLNGTPILVVDDQIGHENIVKMRSYGGDFVEYYVIHKNLEERDRTVDVRSSVECGARPGLSTAASRIIGGENAKPGEFPWQAALRRKTVVPWGRNHLCGASIIKSCWLITAAHCVANAGTRNYLVRVGDLYNDEDQAGNIYSEDQQEYDIKNVFIPENYTHFPTPRNDIALIELQPPNDTPSTCIRFSKFVQPICLPLSGDAVDTKSICEISGWGAMNWTDTFGASRYPHVMQKAKVSIQNHGICRTKYGRDRSGNFRLVPNTVCAADPGIDSCQGDSGGPLACMRDINGMGTNFILWGVTSWGDGCAHKTKPGIYTRVASFLDFIQSHVERPPQI